MAWIKEEEYSGPVQPRCFIANPVEKLARMDKPVAVGFGTAQITKDGTAIFNEEDSGDFHFLSEFEVIAKADPDHDWRLILHAPLSGEEYQRQGDERWVLIASNEGFA